MLKELTPGVKDHGTGNPLTPLDNADFTTLVLHSSTVKFAACLQDSLCVEAFAPVFVTNWITAVLRAERLGLFGSVA